MILRFHTCAVLLGASALAGMVATAPQALAQGSEAERMRQSMQAMQRQLVAMQRRLIELETTQNTTTEAARNAQQEAAAAQRMAQGTAPVPQGRLANSFAVPGTDGRARVRISGFAKANAAIDSGVRNNSDSITASAIPLSGSAAYRQDGNLQTSARRSRVRLESEIETGWTGDWRFSNQVLEFDFAGSNASASSVGTSNAYNPRLRLAYVTLGPVMVGQNASLYQFPSNAQAERLDDGTFIGTSGVRQVGVRYTANLGSGLRGALSLESPYSDVTSTAVTNLNNDNNGGASASNLFGSNNVPDVIAALDYTQPWGGVAARGLARQIKIDNQGDSNAANRFTESTYGFGGGLGGWLNMGEVSSALDGHRLFGVVNYGEGIGRYLDGTSNGFGATTSYGLAGVTAANSRFDAVNVLTGMVGYRLAWTPTLRSNFVYAYAEYDYADYVRQFTTTAGNVNTRVQQASVNLIWSPRPWVDVGFEYIYANRDVLNPLNTTGSGGTDNRFQASFIGRF
jgi:hypothetical protein